MAEGAGVGLTSIQRRILLETYRVKGHQGRIDVARMQGSTPVSLTFGDKRLSSAQAMDALSNLYSRGLVQQKELNRFVLTEAGRQMARHIQPPRH